MLEIGALGALEVLAGKCAIWRPSGWKRAGLEAAPGWIWLVGNPMGKGSGS